MTSKEIRNLFLEFFKEKGHTIVPSSSLVSDDPSVLFTTAGMQQFKPYYLGEKSPYGNNVVSVQKCLRTSDIDSVGDESHLTFFEMLGNFSFGGYFKEEAIQYAYEFITGKKWMNLKIAYVTVFDGKKVPEGDWRKSGTSRDPISYHVWYEIFKKEGLNEKEINEKIHLEGIDNFWGPTGDKGPCGPTTEIYVENSEKKAIEIWNIVFNQFNYDKNKNKLKFLDTFGTSLNMVGIDTGMGLERLTMVVQNKPTIFETDLFQPITDMLPENLPGGLKRIISDHIRGAVFMIADGLKPSNKESGYVLRRILRRLMVYEKYHNLNNLNDIILKVIQFYGDTYKELPENEKNILDEFNNEREKFSKTLQTGVKELEKLNEIDAKTAFKLYETYGLPFEIIQELARRKGLNLNREDFDKEFAKHQEISRAGLEKKFGGHGLKEGGEITGTTEEENQKIVRLHTATHLLHQALFDVLGNQIKQMGSDINPERLRFDFPFERKLTAEEIAKLEAIINQKIKEALPVRFEEKSKDEAIAEGAKAFFKVKYPEKVKVYSIGDPSTGASTELSRMSSGQVYSKEICNGPHVKNTSEIGKFKILKEESVGAGVRRIKATVE